MRLHAPDCPQCRNTRPAYSTKYDAYYCQVCDLWLEEDTWQLEGCPYGGPRPVSPSEVGE